MAEIKVNSTALRNSSTALNNEANRFAGLVTEIKGGMRSMKSQWMGDAADSFIHRFDDLSNNFEAYIKVIRDYANFLNTAAQEFETAENQIRQGQDVPLNETRVYQ